MAAHTSAVVVCAWCHRTVVNAQPGSPVTHTICHKCANWTFTHGTLESEGAFLADAEYIDLPPRGDVDVNVTKH